MDIRKHRVKFTFDNEGFNRTSPDETAVPAFLKKNIIDIRKNPYGIFFAVKGKNLKMEGDVTKMNTEEIERRIKDLENTYAELLQHDNDKQLLGRIWRRIQELRLELSKRMSC